VGKTGNMVALESISGWSVKEPCLLEVKKKSKRLEELNKKVQLAAKIPLPQNSSTSLVGRLSHDNLQNILNFVVKQDRAALEVSAKFFKEAVDLYKIAAINRKRMPLAALGAAAQIMTTLKKYGDLIQRLEIDFKDLRYCSFLRKLRSLAIEDIPKDLSDGQVASCFSALPLSLVHLDVGLNELGVEFAEAIAHSPFLKNLKSLSIQGNWIGQLGVEAIMASKNLTKLESLNLGFNTIGDEGAKKIAASVNLSHLTHLDIENSQISLEGLMAIADSLYIENLQYLNIKNNLISQLEKNKLIQLFKKKNPFLTLNI
jgi:Leucine Rich repeat